jgi:signal recognition particle subunit SRP54
VLPVNLNDFRNQLVEMKKLGSFGGLMRQRPDANPESSERSTYDAAREIKRLLGIIDATTEQERRYPVLLTVPKRCLRVAEGAGIKPAEVSSFFAQFQTMRDAMLRFPFGGRWNV